MYVLDSRLQAGQQIDKWEARARLAVYIGNSINHAANVGLALSLTTGLVSPAFHAKYDDGFTTVAQSYGGYVPKSQWQVKCGFIEDNTMIEPFNDGPDQFLPKREDTSIEGVVDTMTPSTDTTNTPIEDGTINPSIQEATHNKQRTDTMPTEKVVTATDAPVRTTRSGRVSKKPSYLQDYVGYETLIFDDMSYDFTEWGRSSGGYDVD
jgi:hypothetical protein